MRFTYDLCFQFGLLGQLEVVDNEGRKYDTDTIKLCDEDREYILVYDVDPSHSTFGQTYTVRGKFRVLLKHDASQNAREAYKRLRATEKGVK